MGLPANKKLQTYAFSDFSGGVNINDPAISLSDNQLADCLNVIIEKKGVKRWCGCENLTAKDACAAHLRGLYHSAEISGTQHLLTFFGGKVYEINKSTGALTEIYNPTGTGEFWGTSHWGKFYAANGTKVFKIEGSTASPVGITAPAAGSAAAAAGGSLPDGVYKIYLGFARKVSTLNVLYSQGFATANVTLGGGNNTIAITGFTNSTDGQVNNKVVWMTDADGATYYFYYETDNNTTTSFNITSASAKQNAIIYDTFGFLSGLPAAFTSLVCFDNRICGILGNSLYYSMKGTTSYDLERFPAINKIDYPFQLTGLFSIGTTLYLNTADNGILMQDADFGSRFSHFEKRVSFKFMRTVADWNGGKIGLTKDGLQFFDGQKFLDFDFSFNIKPVVNSMYSTADTNFQPVGIAINRNNRLEYCLSFRNTTIGNLNNNRTYVLDLSQTVYQDNQNFKTPWEIVDRGFNYAVIDASGAVYYGQSFDASSTIYKDLLTHTTQKGIYNGAGTYLTAATNMDLVITSKIHLSNMFTLAIIEEMRALFRLGGKARLSLYFVDDPSKQVVQDTDISAYSTSVWDTFVWDVDSWAVEELQAYKFKGKHGTFGYCWYWKFSQTSDDVNFNLAELDVLATLETGNGL